MPNINQVTLAGHLGKDAVLRHTGNNKPVCSFSLATSDGVGEKKQTEWHNVVVWGKAAEVAANFRQGDGVVILGGRLKTRSWEKDGVKRYTTEVHTFQACKSEKVESTASPGPLAEDELPF